MKKWVNAIIFTLSAFSFSILIGYGLVFGLFGFTDDCDCHEPALSAIKVMLGIAHED